MHRGFIYAGKIAAIAVMVGLLSGAARAQQGSISALALGRMDSRRAVPGGSFFVKTTSAWKQGRCNIDNGATLEGRIANVQRKGSGIKHEEVELRFLEIPCPGDEAQEIIPVLVAMQGPHHDSREDFIVQQQLVGVFASAARHVPNGSGSPGGASGGASSPGAIGSGTPGSLGNFSSTALNEQPLHVAEVRGLLGVKLSPPIMIFGPTTLSSSSQILIDPGTRFLIVVQLVARPAAQAPMAKGAPPPSPVPKTIAPPVQENVEIEQCVETGCAFADNPAAAVDSQVDSQLERTLSLHAFGFKVRGNRVLRSLAEDAAVRFLGEDQLLITFNAHPLIVRSQEESARLTNPRIIRALLFSIKTGKILRAEDWRIPDQGPYLWPLDGGRVLAHVGGVLAVYGPGMKVERRWTPLGDIRFLRVSPSRHLIVAAVTRERHTPEQHRRLVDFVGPQASVDEDFELTVLDGELNVQTNQRLQQAPTLSEVLDTGLILSEPGPQESWRVKELDWNGKQRQIVRVNSPCPLRIETLPTNLILAVGCSPDLTRAWYKIVRSNGKTLLTGNVPANGLLEHADAPAGAGVFAIGIGQATHAVDFSQGIVTSDFQNYAVSVYRISDGHRLYATKSANGAVNRQSFALSESGNRLAILSGDAVSLYRIGGPRLANSQRP